MTHTPSGTVNDDLSGAGRAANEQNSYAGSALLDVQPHRHARLQPQPHRRRRALLERLERQEQHVRAAVPGPSAASTRPSSPAACSSTSPPRTGSTDCRRATRSRPTTRRQLRSARRRRAHPHRADDAGPNPMPSSRCRRGSRSMSPATSQELDVCASPRLRRRGAPVEQSPHLSCPSHAYLLAEVRHARLENLWLEDLAALGETDSSRRLAAQAQGQHRLPRPPARAHRPWLTPSSCAAPAS